MDFFATLSPDTITLLLAMLGLAALIMRTTARLDADRRAAEQREMQRPARFDSAMDDFRKEMQRLAERQARVEHGIAPCARHERMNGEAWRHG